MEEKSGRVTNVLSQSISASVEHSTSKMRGVSEVYRQSDYESERDHHVVVPKFQPSAITKGKPVRTERRIGETMV